MDAWCILNGSSISVAFHLLPPEPPAMAETPVRAAAASVETMSDAGSEWMVIDDEGSKPKAEAKTGLDQDSELDLCFICDSWHFFGIANFLAHQKDLKEVVDVKDP